jgi:hypothetical protein
MRPTQQPSPSAAADQLAALLVTPRSLVNYVQRDFEMNEQSPLIPIFGLQHRSSEDQHQQAAPGAPPPPPAATTKQSLDISLPTSPESLLEEPLPTQSFLTQTLASYSQSKDALLLPENTIPQPPNDGSQRRQFSRKPMPFGGVAPGGEMASPEGQKWHITLWDVSMGGICVVVDSAMEAPKGTLLAISIYENFGFGSAFFNAHLRWRTTEADNTYLGLQFEDQDLLEHGCFLIDYVNTDLAAS